MRQHHQVGEDAPLVGGDEAVGPVAGGELLDLAGDVGVEEAVAVGAEDLQPPQPGAVGQAAPLAQGAVLLGDRLGDCLVGQPVAERNGGFAFGWRQRTEDRAQALVEPFEREGADVGGRGRGAHAPQSTIPERPPPSSQRAPFGHPRPCL